MVIKSIKLSEKQSFGNYNNAGAEIEIELTEGESVEAATAAGTEKLRMMLAVTRLGTEIAEKETQLFDTAEQLKVSPESEYLSKEVVRIQGKLKALREKLQKAYEGKTDDLPF